MLQQQQISTLFPYTTLFRSRARSVVSITGACRFDGSWASGTVPWASGFLGDHWKAPAGLLVNSQSYRSEEHTSELQSQSKIVCRLLLEKKNIISTVLHIYYQ